MAKSLERIKAREMRMKGESIGNIAKCLKVSKSSVSLWCQDIVLTYNQFLRLKKREALGAHRGRIKMARNKIRERLRRRKNFMNQGIKQFKNSKNDILLAIGVALYWAEGYKAGRRLSFCNSDPEMIKLFLFWLRRVYKISEDEIRCIVGINQDHRVRVNEVIKYWVKVTGVPEAQFDKTSYKKVINKKIYENFKDHYGTLNIRVLRSTNLFYKIEGCIEALKNMAA